MLRKINFGKSFFVGVIIFSFVFFSSFILAEVADKAESKVIIPRDAIIIPYSPELDPSWQQFGRLPKLEDLRISKQTVIVPLSLHNAMVDLVRSAGEKRLGLRRLSPVNIAVSSAEYFVDELPQSGSELILSGKVQIYQYKNEGVLLPFYIQNSVIESPQLDGKPASISSVSDSQFVLHVSGEGEHIFSFKVRVKVQQQGGWRIAEGVLPTASTSKVQITLPSEAGDFLMGNPLDVRKWASGKDTAGANKTITTALEQNGKFAWRWRSAISEGQVDRSLEVESLVRFDLQDDAAWILWMPQFKISRGKWEALRLQIPKIYTIVEIAGENVRGWNIVTENNTENNKGENNDTQIINIDLLKPAEKEEVLQVRLLNISPEKKADSGETWKLSTLSVPEAGIHRGRIDLYRSSVRKFRVTEVNGAVLTDQPKDPISITTDKFNTTSPLGTESFQSYRFISEPFDLSFNSNLLSEKASVNFQSILKVTHKRSVLETKISLRTGNNNPFFATIKLPDQFKLKNVTAPNTLFYSHEVRDKENLLYVSHGNKTNDAVNIAIEGEYIPIVPIEDKDKTNKNNNSAQNYKIDQLPVFSVEFTGVESRNISKYSTIELLTDPSLSASAVDLKNCGLINSRSDSSNIISPREQRSLVRLIIESWVSKFGAKLVFSDIESEVLYSTITNVRTTDDAINETILLDFDIKRAGVREIKFTLPDWMKDAVIESPLLQRKKITEREIKNGDGVFKLVDVTLELQERVVDHLRVLVHADRKLRSGQEYKIFAPIIETGIASSQYVVMENDRMSPDEMVVDQPTIKNLKNLDRRQQEWNYLASILGENVTEAYYVQKTDYDKKTQKNSFVETSLTFTMKRRDAVRLPEARINKSETRLVFDRNGEYRAEQIYFIDNQKEPYLDIFLPEGASLWGVRFFKADEWQERDSMTNTPNQHRSEGLPVKPCLMPLYSAQIYLQQNATQTITHTVKNAVYEGGARIPLIKTVSGDLDYVVRIVYAGKSRGVRNLSSSEMPFIKVANVPVGTSLLKLYLPEEYKYFFKGSMQHVAKEQTNVIIKKINDDYTQQIGTRLQQTIEEDNVYAQQRAFSNMLSNTELQSKNFANDFRQMQSNENVQPMVVQQPQQNAQPYYDTTIQSNSFALRNQFETQSNTLSSQIMNKKSIVVQVPQPTNERTRSNAGKNLSNKFSDFVRTEKGIDNTTNNEGSFDACEAIVDNVKEDASYQKSKSSPQLVTNQNVADQNVANENGRRSQAVYNGNIVLGVQSQLQRQQAFE
ncbi:MAG: hypothetical protein LBH59_06080, partial [Planctomycetaceae bacterium]|nr:hypothetical protein [Planctomycetaceae bacterium]